MRETAAAAITTPKPPANRRAGAGPSKDVRGESRNPKEVEDVYGPGVFSKQSAWCPLHIRMHMQGSGHTHKHQHTHVCFGAGVPVSVRVAAHTLVLTQGIAEDCLDPKL